MNDLNIFIISWKGKHHQALEIHDALRHHSSSIYIIYSDPDENYSFREGINAVRRPNSLFWADKFQTCLNLTCHRPMLVIHADCSCNDWRKVLQRAIVSMTGPLPIAIWSPHIVSGMHFPLHKVHIASIHETHLSIVARIDGLVFALSPDVVVRMRRACYKDNVYGLGIGWMFCSFGHATQRLIVIDRSVQVHHSTTRGYNLNTAKIQMHSFLRQLDTHEMIQYILLDNYCRRPKTIEP